MPACKFTEINSQPLSSHTLLSSCKIWHLTISTVWLLSNKQDVLFDICFFFLKVIVAFYYGDNRFLFYYLNLHHIHTFQNNLNNEEEMLVFHLMWCVDYIIKSKAVIRRCSSK